MKDKQEVRSQRESVYGSPLHTGENVGQHWTAILRTYLQDQSFPVLPPRIVHLMMVALKIHRAATPFEKKDADSYIDLHNYADFALESDDTLPQKKDLTKDVCCLCQKEIGPEEPAVRRDNRNSPLQHGTGTAEGHGGEKEIFHQACYRRDFAERQAALGFHGRGNSAGADRVC